MKVEMQALNQPKPDLSEPGSEDSFEQKRSIIPAKLGFDRLAGLGNWNYYFILKFVLYFQSFINFNALANLGFAAFILLPTEKRIFKLTKQIIAWPLAVVLLYRDSWLPPFSHFIDQFHNIRAMNFSFLLEFLQRFFNLEIFITAFILWVVFVYLRQWIRVSVFTTLAMIAFYFNLWGPQTKSALNSESVASTLTQLSGQNKPINQAETLDQTLAKFFAYEQGRKVDFPANIEAHIPFDVLILNICSLSWSDLKFTGMAQHPLFKQFDILFTAFNTAASYSGPAVKRLLSASCGQASHGRLYESGDNDCYLFNNLAQLGFKNQLLLNHNGQFDNFIDLVQDKGRLNATPLLFNNIKISQRFFDGSPVYSDLDTLNRWLQQRNQAHWQRSATFYNTISLHDGNRLTGDRSKLNSLENFRPRMVQMLSDLTRFFTALQRSNRRVLVVMVPEHGAAIEGDALQVAGFRDIPSPGITHVPVGFRLFGPGISRPLNTISVAKSSSYLAVSYVIGQILQADPFGQGSYPAAKIANAIPSTHFVAENEGTTLLKKGQDYWMRYDNSDWIKYPTKKAL